MHRIALHLLVVAALSFLSACRSPAVASPDLATAQAPISQPFLWQVTKADGSATGYLLGTMHIGIDAEKQFPPLVWDTLAKADSVCLEADTRDLSLAREMIRSDGTTLDSEVGPEVWAQLTEIVGARRARIMNKLKPSAASAFLMVEGMPKTPPMDDTVRKRATRAGTPVEFLEEGRFQLQLLEKYFTADSIKAMVENHADLQQESLHMAAVYASGDADALHAMMVDDEQWEANGGEAALEAMLFTRNADWVGKYTAMMDKGTPFCAVGAGHLVGERSLTDLLENDGYTVTRLTP